MRKNIYIIISAIFLFSLAIIFSSCGIKAKAPERSIEPNTGESIKQSKPDHVPKSETPKQSNEEKSKDLSEKQNTNLRDYNNPDEVRIPVLMFHSIQANGKNNLMISPSEFARKMDWLKNNNYTTLSMDEAYSMITTGKNVPEKPVVLTFDDGYVDNYTNAYPILKGCDFKATIFMITNNINEGGFLSSEQIKEMYNNKIDFQSHTASHLELNLLSYNSQLNEMRKSKTAIENLIHNNTNVLCYPVGKYNENTIRAAKDAGYNMCFTTKYGFAKNGDGLYFLRRIRMVPGMSMNSIKIN